jgi:hypothetical protein
MTYPGPYFQSKGKRIMKTSIYKYLLLIGGILITGTGMSQSVHDNVVPFKEINQKQSTENFTAREIEKKELEITPTQIPLLRLTCNQPGKEAKSRKKEKAQPVIIFLPYTYL